MDNLKNSAYHDNGFYREQYPTDKNSAKLDTGYRVNINVSPTDMVKVYNDISDIADERELRVAFAMSNTIDDYYDPNMNYKPMIVLYDTQSLENPQEVLSQIESVLVDADVSPATKEDLNGKPIKGSKHMDYSLHNKEKYGDGLTQKPMPQDKFALVEIAREIKHQDDLGIDDIEKQKIEYEEAKAKVSEPSLDLSNN